MAPPRKRPAESAVDEEEKSKRTRKPPFTDEEVTTILHCYEEKLVVFKNDTNNSRVQLSQRKEWEAIARLLNAKNLLITRTWEEVRKKYQNMVSLAKTLNTQKKNYSRGTGGGNPSEELPSWASFIIDRLLPSEILNGVEGGFESGVPPPTLITWTADGDSEDGDEAPEAGDQDVTTEQVEEPPQPTPRPIVERTPTKRRTLDNAHYDALVAEKEKFEAETEKLREEAAMMRAKTQVLDLKRQLLEIELSKRRGSDESQY